MSKFTKPTGDRRDEMVASPAWPEIDEDDLLHRHNEYERLRTQLVSVKDTWDGYKSGLFNPNAWFGGAATSAQGKVDGHVTSMKQLDSQLKAASGFYLKAYRAVYEAKDRITKATDKTQDDVGLLDSAKDAKKIEKMVNETFLSNADRVDQAVHQVSSFGSSDGSNPQNPEALPGTTPHGLQEPPGPADLTAAGGHRPEPEKANPAGPADLTAAGGHRPEPEKANPAGPADLSASGGTPPGPAGPGPLVQAVQGSGGPSGPSKNGDLSPNLVRTDRVVSNNQPIGSTARDLGRAGGSPSISDLSISPNRDGANATAGDKNGAAAGDKNQVPTSLTSQQQVAHDLAQTAGGGQQPNVSPAAAHGPPTPPAQPLEPAAAVPSGPHHGGGGPSGPGGGGGHGGSIGGGDSTPSYSSGGSAPPPMSLGAPATPPPAGPVGSGGGSGGGSSSGGPAQPTGPGVNPMSTSNSSAAAAAMGPAPVPVSQARLERDTIAASTAGAGASGRRRGGANDPLTLARRIGAALNAGVHDFGFFWVTGLCADGSIVVANSYGLAYIPDGINLPPQVHFATADEAIPPGERAKWATYPVLAVQGWAQARDLTLRAVIATAEQFASFDPGAAKIVLRPDDIPDSGAMQGRSRLEVIAPSAATRLAAVSDVALTELLPPASADTGEPVDNAFKLWFNVAKPLMSTMPDRGLAHLQAMIVYADHAQELALHRAHTATDGPTQRAAIADWVYWQHVSVLTSDALDADVSV